MSLQVRYNYPIIRERQGGGVCLYRWKWCKGTLVVHMIHENICRNYLWGLCYFAGYISLFSRFWRICKLWRKRCVLWRTSNLISTADDMERGRGVVTKEKACLLWNPVYPAPHKQSSKLSYFANAFTSKDSILEEFEILKHLKHLTPWVLCWYFCPLWVVS